MSAKSWSRKAEQGVDILYQQYILDSRSPVTHGEGPMAKSMGPTNNPLLRYEQRQLIFLFVVQLTQLAVEYFGANCSREVFYPGIFEEG